MKSVLWKNTKDSWENITRMVERNSERYMKRRLTIPGGEEQDDSEQVGGGFFNFFFSETLKIDSTTS